MDLTNKRIKNTYGGLLNIGSTGASEDLKQITDGFGVPLPMMISESGVYFTGEVGASGAILGATGPTRPTGATGPIGATGSEGHISHYGNFYDTTIQTNIGGETGNAILLNSVVDALGISVEDGSKITFTQAGNYDLQFSLQVQKTDSGTDEMELWLVKNGDNEIWSNTRLYLTGPLAKEIFSINYQLNAVEPEDYYELWWYSNDSAIEIYAETTINGRPSIPSAIVTIAQISNIITGATGAAGSSGSSGISGSSGTSGVNGSSGAAGSSGSSGIAGSSGTSGVNGSSGAAGSSGSSGISGSSGTPGSSGTSGIDGPTGDPGLLSIREIGGSGSIELTDAGKLIVITSSSLSTLEVPEDDDVNFPIGTNILIVRGGTGDVQVTYESPVQILSINSYTKLNSQYSGASLLKYDANTWFLLGDLKV